MNNVMIGGHLAKDFELKTSEKDVSYGEIVLTNNGYKEGQVNFFSVSSFGSTADYIAKNYKKGSGLIVSGELCSRTYTPEGSTSQKTFYYIKPNNLSGIEPAEGKLQINTICCTANLTRDPEIRFTQIKNSKVANMGLAIDFWNYKEGKNQKETVFIRGVAYDKNAELAEAYLKKSSRIFIKGYLQANTWEDDKKVKHTTLELIIENMNFIKKKSADQTAGESTNSSTSGSSYGTTNTPSSSGFTPTNFDDDDDLPF